ncbi:MAG: DMT family transporter [Candidatus Pacebacteria bacterium]|nr:DMT family transporter [Candidatus Paceibacterota bacterium]
MSFLFSYLGNTLSLRSIELAPNPGFSLVISKSYVVFTTLAAVVLFGAELTLISLFSIGLIVLGSALIMIEPNKKNGSNKTIKTKTTDKNSKIKKLPNTSTNKSLWIWFAIGAFFCWGMLALTSKYLLDIGVNILSRLVYSMIIVSSIIGWEIYTKKVSLKLPKKQWLILLAIGLTGATFNYFMQLSYQLAPNLGFVNALNASSIAVVAILSGLIFKDELNIRKILGVGVVISGIILLVN